MPLAPAPLPDLRTLVGFGVAGNFAGHLAQAGEAADFVRVAADGSGQAAGGVAEPPKGIFPWYIPGAGAEAALGGVRGGSDAGTGSGSSRGAVDVAALDPLAAAQLQAVPAFLGTFPISHDQIVLPPDAGDGDGLNLQIEPEVGLIVELVRDPATGAVTAIEPRAMGAFNDCSIRREGAKKISHKKNWGPASKGLSRQLLAVDDLSPDGPTATWRLACFLRRDGAAQAYGVDSALPDYSYYGATLLDWIVERLTGQLGSDDTPLEPVGRYLDAARVPSGGGGGAGAVADGLAVVAVDGDTLVGAGDGLAGNGAGLADARPTHALMGIGATRYTAVGESTFLHAGDESIVIVYDAVVNTPEQIAAAVDAATESTLTAASVLCQRVNATA